MNSQKDLLVITASNGENLKLAEKFIESGNHLGISSSLIDLTAFDIPLFNPRENSNNNFPETIKNLSKKMIAAPRWVICAPEYNGSIPPILTNTIAWLSIEEQDFRMLFNGRPIALASFSGGGCMEVLISMRIQLTHLGAQVVGRQLASNKNQPAKAESIESLLKLLIQLKPLSL